MSDYTTSTQFFVDQIEQLDLALDQLALRDRNFNRFAMLLIDNVVELSLHRYAVEQELQGRLTHRLKRGDVEKLVVEATGQHFDAKVRLARARGVLAAEMADAVIYLHNFRNTAHHRGLRHEGILHSLAVLYFRSACTILSAAHGGSAHFSSSSSDVVPFRSMKYLGSLRRGSLAPDQRGRPASNACQRLSEIAETLGDTLVENLCADLASTVDSADRTMQFLAEEGSGELSRDRVIVEVQASCCSRTLEVKKFAEEGMRKGRVTVYEYHVWIRDNYPWPIKVDPIPAWRRRLMSLRSERNPYAAVKKYCDFLAQTEKVREMISKCGADLDAIIQQQIDEARGK